MFENLVAKIAGGFLRRRLNLKEDHEMDETKKWYESRNIWTGVVTAVLGLYLSLAASFGWPAIPEWIFAILGALGVYTRTTATAKIQ